MELITTDDRRWLAVLEESDHDFYHFPSYLDIASADEGGVPKAYYAEVASNRVLIPLLIRKLPEVLEANSELADATSPYGYPGPLLTKRTTLEDAREAIIQFVEIGKDLGLVTTFLRLHPLLHGVIADEGFEDERISAVKHGLTVAIDLTLDTDTLNGQIRENHRRDIRKLERKGFTMRLDHWEDFTTFQEVYLETMRRVDAHPRYFFDHTYFDRLRDYLDTRLHLCTILSPDGEVASAGIFTLVGNIMQYHLGGTAEEYLSSAPSKLMFVKMRDWGKRMGASMLHLGGGVGGQEDSLLRFKSGFSDLKFPFKTVRIIHNPEVYRELNEKRNRMFEGTQNSVGNDFFPPYRAIGNRELDVIPA